MTTKHVILYCFGLNVIG